MKPEIMNFFDQGDVIACDAWPDGNYTVSIKPHEDSLQLMIKTAE
jgi:hypothetical protein